MRNYNTKNWFSVFTFYRHDTARTLLPGILGIGVYSYLVTELIRLSWFQEAGKVFDNFIIVHTLLGIVISFLLVFRTNTAYDRWWEGRKLWGALVNNSRNLAIKMHALLPEGDRTNRQYFVTFISMYAKALHQHLKSRELEFSLDEFENPEGQKIDPKKHLPNQIASMLQNKVYTLYKEKTISGDELITLNNETSSFTDICGACERIKNTPIPYSYASFIKKFILLYVLTLPWSLATKLGYWDIAVVIFVTYALSSLEIIAEEIEEPFGTDDNDLPTEKISENIERDVREILLS